jgi:hypothetical protein
VPSSFTLRRRSWPRFRAVRPVSTGPTPVRAELKSKVGQSPPRALAAAPATDSSVLVTPVDARAALLPQAMSTNRLAADAAHPATPPRVGCVAANAKRIGQS